METYQDLEGYPKRDDKKVLVEGIGFVDPKRITYLESDAENPLGKEVDPASVKGRNLVMGSDMYRGFKLDNPSYFTPDITDIRVGYECETSWSYEDKYTPSILKSAADIFGLVSNNLKIRVPYLTKEQIEKEGWVEEDSDLAKSFSERGVIRFKRGHTYLYWDKARQLLEVMNLDFSRETTRILGYEDDTNFKGKCKDINTFRYICKLLGI